MPDAMVIGAGPNGLVAGNYLADAGWDVLLLEAGDEVGGAVRSGELVEPGFTSDLFSAFYPLAVASPAIRPLRLEEHGLRWCRSALACAHPTPGGGHAAIATDDLDASAGTCGTYAAREGGAGRLGGGMAPRLEARGGRLELGTRVERLVVRRGRAVAVQTADGRELPAGRAVLADVAAPALFLELVGEEHLPAGLLAGLRRFEWDGGTVKVDWTLDGPIPWEAAPVGEAGTVHVGRDMDELSRHALSLAIDEVPERPFLVLGQYHAIDPTRAPEGKEVAWAYTHVPQRVRDDAAGEGLTGASDSRSSHAPV